jgi:hypothetical protein
MKKTILSLLLAAALMPCNAQTVTDTVSVGASYANQVWYSLSADEQGNAPKNNWDIAFDASGFGASIMINSVTGTTLWKYPKADTAGWGSIDTTGLSTWASHWNSDTSWAYGAMGNYANHANPYDLDWGLYNITTHIVTGDSVYIIKLANGQYKKLWIQSLAGSTYTFQYANLDGTGLQNATFDKSGYTGKNYGYYSLQNNAALNREPLSANWDLVFTQYTTFIPSAYTVTGVLANKGVMVAKVSGLPNAGTYTNYGAATFNREMNTIGYNWKTFTGTTYVTQDSLVYFVKPVNGDIWKVIFTGFGGSANGNFIFTKQKLFTAVGIETVSNAPAASMALFPNPSNGQAEHIAYSFDANIAEAALHVMDITGRTVATDNLDNTAGLHQYLFSTQSLRPGIYLVSIETPGSRVQQKLIIQ